MKIMVVHNRYQLAGGEDHVVSAETDMLAGQGQTVERLEFDNESITSPLSRLAASGRFLYSRPAFRRVAAALGSFQPDVLHVHNFLPTLSPSVFFAASAANVPVVQTLHNYRLLCASGTLYRDGQVCEECPRNDSFLPGVRHACYRSSRLGSAIVGGTMALHASLGTWQRRIHRYVALTDFAASRLGGDRVPAARLRVKPNFAPDHGVGTGQGGFMLFVGRLSEEKGIRVLLEADARRLLPMPIRIVGEGPLLEEVMLASQEPGSKLQVLGRQRSPEIIDLMQQASALLVPSLWYEGFPMVIVEAFSTGLPIIASRLGSLSEIVQEGVTGLLFEPGNAAALAQACLAFSTAESEAVAAMRAAARQRYCRQYGKAANYATLMNIYAEARQLALAG